MKNKLKLQYMQLWVKPPSVCRKNIYSDKNFLSVMVCLRFAVGFKEAVTSSAACEYHSQMFS
jgi:hypothetical protein